MFLGKCLINTIFIICFLITSPTYFLITFYLLACSWVCTPLFLIIKSFAYQNKEDITVVLLSSMTQIQQLSVFFTLSIQSQSTLFSGFYSMFRYNSEAYSASF